MKPLNQPLSARLHHIGLASPDPEALANFYKSAMGLKLRQTGEGILGQAIGRNLFFVKGAPKDLQLAAFAVEDENNLHALRERVVEANCKHVPSEDNSMLFAPGAIALDDPDGNHLIFGMPHAKETWRGNEMPARLQHVVVASRDAGRLSKFYQTVLGFSLSDIIVDDQHNMKTAFLRCSEEHHSFAVFQASNDRLDHHCYEAGEWALIRDWGDHFAALEIKIEWGPGRHGPGNNLFLFIHDIDGNWLEISAELESVKSDRPVGEWPHAQRTLNSWGTAPLRT